MCCIVNGIDIVVYVCKFRFDVLLWLIKWLGELWFGMFVGLCWVKNLFVLVCVFVLLFEFW